MNQCQQAGRHLLAAVVAQVNLFIEVIIVVIVIIIIDAASK